MFVRPACTADQQQLQLGNGRVPAVVGGGQQQHQLAGYADHDRAAAIGQAGQRAGGREAALHRGTAARPQSQQGTEQEERVGHAPRCQHPALRGGTEVLQRDAKGFHPGAVITPKALGQARAAGGEPDVERRVGGWWAERRGEGRLIVRERCFQPPLFILSVAEGKCVFDVQRGCHAGQQGRWPVRIGHGGAASAVDDPQKGRQQGEGVGCLGQQDGIGSGGMGDALASHGRFRRTPGAHGRMEAGKVQSLFVRAVRVLDDGWLPGALPCPAGQGGVDQPGGHGRVVRGPAAGQGRCRVGRHGCRVPVPDRSGSALIGAGGLPAGAGSGPARGRFRD